MNLPTTFVTAAMLLSMAMPVLAAQGDVYTNTGAGPKVIIDGSPGSSPSFSSAHQHQQQNQSATGGTATGGSSVNNLSVTGGSYSGGGGGTRAPDIVLPSFGGGGMDCPTVGFGAAGSGLGGGGGFGPSWISADCNARKLAAEVWDMGDHDQAREILHKQFPTLYPRPEIQTVSAQVPRPRAEAFCRSMDMRRRPLTGREISDYTQNCR